MANITWTKTTSGPLVDTLGNPVGSGDGAGTITMTAAQIRVSNGNTLRIEEGVTIKMLVSAGTERFLVERNATGSGTLRIVGTEAEPVIFTSTAVTPAAGDYANCVEMSNAVAASNPTFEADWCIFQHSITGIFSASTQPNTVTLRNCTFRRISQSHIQGTGPVTAGNGVWSFTDCVFDKCPADGTNANNIIICANATTAELVLDHCSMSVQVLNGTTDIEILQASGSANITARNCIMVGNNSSVTRALNVAVLLTGGTITNDWNWYFTEGLGNYVPAANDENLDPDFFDTSCVMSQDLRPNFNTGALTADEFGALIGALDPYGVPIPPEPTPEEDCQGTYSGFTDPACLPFVCDYEFFTGEYPAGWRTELYDRKEVQPHQLVVCLQIPNRGIPLDFEFAPGVPIPVVGISDESVTVDIGCWVQSMRPIRAERDVTFREYQGSDIDLVIMDWFGRLDPKINPSLFANLRWVGLRVDIGSWIHGQTEVLRHGRYFLQDITRRSESTVIRVRDWFLETLGAPLRANIANYDGSLSFKSNNRSVAFALNLVEIDTDTASIESVRLIMQDEGREDSRKFQYVGSVTGDQGIGSFDADFTTADGSIVIPQAAWASTLVPEGVFAPKDEVTFTIANLATGTPVAVIYDYLVNSGPLVVGVDIDQAEFFEAEQLLPTMAEMRIMHTKPVTLLEACRVAAAHGFLTLSTNAEGHVVLGGFKPTLELSLSEIQDVAICSSNDLKELETENLPVYNLIRSSYNPVQSDGNAHSGIVGDPSTRWLNYPTEDLGPNFNRSAEFWGAFYPLDVALPGFRAGQEAAVFAILQNYWVFFEGTPTAREKLTLDTKLHNLNRDLEDIVRVESLRPARQIWAQVIGYGKAPLSQNIELTVVDISDIVQPNFSCGYAFCDVGHYTDDCWVVW